VKNKLRLTLLGTGDTIGTPKVGCTCENCLYAKENGRERLRTSLLLEHEGKRVLIDTSPDLRQQLLMYDSPHIDAVIWTHGHYDHFSGYNEFYRVQKFPPAYAAPPVRDYIKKVFSFLKFEANAVPVYEPFDLFGITFTLVEVNHPPAYTCGVIIECCGKKIAYTADTNPDIPKKSLKLMMDADLLLADALMPSNVNIGKHMNYGDACHLSEKLGVTDFRTVHMSHQIGWDWDHIGSDGEVFEF